MEQLQLAIRYLDKRAISTTHINNKLMKQFVKVLRASEVDAVLKMVVKGEFKDFYNEMAEKHHPDFI